jgi:hypothetical protein
VPREGNINEIEKGDLIRAEEAAAAAAMEVDADNGVEETKGSGASLNGAPPRAHEDGAPAGQEATAEDKMDIDGDAAKQEHQRRSRDYFSLL